MTPCPDSCHCACHFDEQGRNLDPRLWTAADHAAEDERLARVRAEGDRLSAVMADPVARRDYFRTVRTSLFRP
jgi:hypothetical protein